jgi:hypothetical protein
MSRTKYDDLETHLRDLFERQGEAIAVHVRAWDDPPMATVVPLPNPRRSRPALAAITATAAAVALVVGIAAIGHGSGVRVAGQPGSAVPVHFSTPQVTLDADALVIDADGQNFTSGGSVVDVHSDPGTPNEYTTLELTWPERDVEMRLYMYFKSDGRNWWSNEIRTYNGKTPGDWIFYTGTYFREPLGTAFVGNVDLAATEGTGHLRLPNLRLQPFLPPAACKNATTRYALNIAYDHVEFPNAKTDGFGIGIPMLLDTATCTQVPDASTFEFDYAFTTTGIAGIDIGNNRLLNAQNDVAPTQGVQLAPISAGSTRLRVTALQRSTGKVVATVDIPVTVG